MTLTLQTFLIVCPMLFLAGLVDAIGGGGGLISLPAYLLAGVPMHNAIATNKLSSTCGTTLTTVRFIRQGLVNWKIAIPTIVFAMLGSSLGANLSMKMDEGIMQNVLFVVLPVVAFVVMNPKLFRDKAENQLVLGKRLWITVNASAFLIGMYDGFYGPGTGTFLLLIFCNLAKLDLRSASGNVKIVNFSSNIGALATALAAGTVLVPVGLIAAVFSIAGHYLGAGVTIKNGAKIVKPVIFLVLGLLAVKIILELFGIA